MRFYHSILVGAVLAVNAQAADVPQVTPNGAESLGNRLLDDLSPEVPRPIAPQQPQQPAAPQINGFGVSDNATSQPLARVRQGMQSAELLLTQPAVDSKAGTVRLAGTVQQKVLSD